jgi:hypothetical protein
MRRRRPALVTMFGEPVVKPAASGLALLLLAVCCESCGGSTTGPSQAVKVNIILSTDGAFSATFQGTTITAQGAQETVRTFNLDPGTYQVSGQMQSPFLDVAFARPGTGGVARDSITAPSGPGPQVGHCDASFLTLAPPQSFSVSFTVSTSNDSACQGP